MHIEKAAICSHVRERGKDETSQGGEEREECFRLILGAFGSDVAVLVIVSLSVLCSF